MAITKKQKEVFDYISNYSGEHGFAPTQKEIKEYFGLKSFGSVQRYLKYLVNAGYLESDWNARRGIKITTSNNDNVIPLLGLIAAGNPIEAINNPLNTIKVPPELLKPGGAYYALTIQGDSMIEEGILGNDIAIIQHQETANQGQIVVGVIDGEATLKRFYNKKNQVELHPANHQMSVIHIDKSQNFQIAGVLVGLIRSYL